MIKKTVRQAIQNHRDIAAYLLFGFLTTLVNVVAYWVCAHTFHFPTTQSAAIAWLVAVVFAYLTNRKLVFHSKAKKKKDVLIEVAAFFVCRLLTGLLDIVIMHVFVDKYGHPDIIVKIISNIVVIIANYILSKLVIFRKDDGRDTIKKCLIVLSLLAIGFLLAEQSPYGLWKNGFGSYDTNVYRAIGTTIKNGGMPYKDVFDHKGPLLHIIYALGAIVDDARGIWPFAFLAITTSTVLIYLISRKMNNSRPIALLSTIIVWTPAIASGYLKHEASCCSCVLGLPFVLYSAYVFIDFFINKKTNKLKLFLCGACFGAILMIRPNMAAVWVAGCIAVLVESIKKKQLKELINYLALFIAGVAAIVLPILMWLIFNGAFGSFIDCYISYNALYSAAQATATTGSRISSIAFFLQNAITGLLFVYSLHRAVNTKKTIDIVFFAYFAINLLFMTIAGLHYDHYGVAIMPALAYPAATFMDEVIENNRNKKRQKNTNGVIIVLLIIGIYIASPWLTLIGDAADAYDYRNTSKYSVDSSLKKAVNVIKANSRDGDSIQVIGGGGFFNIYALSNRKVATKYVYTPRPVGEMVFTDVLNQFSDDFIKAEPVIVVIVNGGGSGYTNTIKQFVDKNYSLISDGSQIKIFKK